MPPFDRPPRTRCSGISAWHPSWLIYPFVEPLHRGRALAGSTIGDMDLSVGIALVALALSGWVAIRQWRRDRVSDEEAKAAFVQVRLIGYDGEKWWRIENHGPQTAALQGLLVPPGGIEPPHTV